MPRPGLPPTPASSTDIRGKNDYRLQTSDIFCTLPPPAIASANHSASSNASDKSDSSYCPVSPTSPAGKSTTSKQKRPMSSKNATSVASSNFSLPQPPTRSRKIIQMNPGSNHDSKSSSTSLTSTSIGKKVAPTPTLNTAAASKRQPSATSVAGRKIARKTAHSLIERRRRSKMNEEFGVLKDMIPACHGQEMHKLAILQASIDYLRYLEQCIVDLKSANGKSQVLVAEHGEETSKSRALQARPSSDNKQSEDEEEDEDEGDDDDDDNEREMDNEAQAHDQDEDQEMVDYSPTATTTPATCPLNSSNNTSPTLNASQTIYISPTIYPTPSHVLQSQTPHASPVSVAPYPYSTSTLPSPAFGPTQYQPTFSPTTPRANSIIHSNSSIRSSTHSSLTSPALLPQAMDIANARLDIEKQEATAALLMLNRDRRASGGAVVPVGLESSGKGAREQGRGGRGMSVRDLLSS